MCSLVLDHYRRRRQMTMDHGTEMCSHGTPWSARCHECEAAAIAGVTHPSWEEMDPDEVVRAQHRRPAPADPQERLWMALAALLAACAAALMLAIGLVALWLWGALEGTGLGPFLRSAP